MWNRVCKRKHVVDDIYAHPEKCRTVSLEYPVQVALREQALEEVRKPGYPQYPSGMSCLYVSEDLSDSYQWFDYFVKPGRPTYQIVKPKIRGNFFVGDANNCFDGVPPILEMLADADIEVMEIVKEANVEALC